jgi:hypothetical protein
MEINVDFLTVKGLRKKKFRIFKTVENFKNLIFMNKITKL